MIPKEIAANAERLLVEVSHIPDIGYANYQELENEYRRILHDLLVLTRENAQAVAELSDKILANGILKLQT